MKTAYTEATIEVIEIYLDQENPRFPPVNSQREAVQTMLKDQGDKIINLASDIYQNGLNPSSKLILFKENGRYIDGDGNRRLTALKILETPSLSDSEPKLRKKVNAILKKDGVIPSDVGCVIFKNREDAKHWISINHSGLQDGRGQFPWDSEQKNRFEGKYTIGLQALDLLLSKGLISSEDKSRIKKSTLDRLLEYSAVKSKLSISRPGEHYSFGDIDNLNRTVLALRDKKVDEVYTAKKGIEFVDSVFAGSSGDFNTDYYVQDNPGFDNGNNPGNQSNFENESNTGSQPNLEATDNPDTQAEPRSDGDRSDQNSTRSRRQNRPGLTVFGGPLSLQSGHINNLYRDIELLHNAYRAKKLTFSDDFVVIFRMSLRMLAETAAREIKKELKDYLIENFDQAKSTLDLNTKTSLSNQSVEKNKIVQLFQTGAHDYHNSRNEEQAVALSIILGAILKVTHGKKS